MSAGGSENISGGNENSGIPASSIQIVEDARKESTDDEKRKRMKVIGAESAVLHRKVAESLWDAYGFKDGNRTITDWICKKFVTNIGSSYCVIMPQNCVLVRYLRNFMQHGLHNRFYARKGSYTIACVLERWTDHLERYLHSLTQRIPPSSL